MFLLHFLKRSFTGQNLAKIEIIQLYDFKMNLL